MSSLGIDCRLCTRLIVRIIVFAIVAFFIVLTASDGASAFSPHSTPEEASYDYDVGTAFAKRDAVKPAVAELGAARLEATVAPTGLGPGHNYDSSVSVVAPTSALDDAVPNTNPFDGAVDQDVFVVDRHGTVLDLSPGESLTSSPDGMWMQVRGPDGSPTGVRLDGPHNPNTHTGPRALVPHTHVPGVTNADGTPWLPRSWIQ